MTLTRSDERRVTVGLVNNMPDSAFVDTEDQFRRVTEAAGIGHADFELYAIGEIARSDQIARIICDRYRDVEELRTRTPDALVVTGTEPTMPDMRLEPAWPALAGLLQWASDAVPTVLLSCLASHASLQLFDGIERSPRPHKCSGVFRGAVIDGDHPLARGLAREVPVPHSRVNEVESDALLDAGYRIVVGGPDGWSVATREQGESLFVLCQGHPEYGTLSLLREYRRDVRRFLLGEGHLTTYPRIPAGYLSAGAERELRRFAERAQRGGDPHRLWAEFPYATIAAGVQNSWAAVTQPLYANWIELARTARHAVA